MAHFLDLPIDLLPLILEHIVKPNHLAAIRLVNHSFDSFAAPRLFEHIFIFAWHKQAKTRVLQLFRTLAECPQLAKWVKRLGQWCSGWNLSVRDLNPKLPEIRDFPKGVSMTSYEELLVYCRDGLKNCVNLRRCAWTRDGSVNGWILTALQSCPSLRELEINGNHNGHYDAIFLRGFDKLDKISLIMPSGPVVDTLPVWVKVTGLTLRSLTLICKTSPLITDTLLQSMATNLTMLEHLHIVGCTKVTHKGVWGLISENANGLVGLGLENLSHMFDMSEFSQTCVRALSLRRLRSITLTINASNPAHIPTWLESVHELLSHAPIEVFQIYSTFACFDAGSVTAMEQFCRDIVTTHGIRLSRVSVHRMRISMQAVIDICQRCKNLEQLFVVIHSKELELLATGLAQTSKLRAVHINYPLEDDGEDIVYPVLSATEAYYLIGRCGSTLTEFGCNSRVWMVDRVTVKDEMGEIKIKTLLLPYESPDVPEQFLVVRS